MSSNCTWIIILALALVHYRTVSGYHCVVIEDDIPSPFTDKHCIQKIRALLFKKSGFSVEVAASNHALISDIIETVNSHAFGGEFISDGVELRAAKSFAAESLQKSVSATLSTAIGYCLWNIVDNLRREKVFDFREWAMDICDCGHSF